MAYGEPNGRMTDDLTWPWKVKVVTPITHYFENSWRCYLCTVNYYRITIPWCSTVVYPSDSLASCYIFVSSDLDLWPLGPKFAAMLSRVIASLN